VTPDDRGRPRKYIHAHNSIGTKQSPEWVAKKTAGMKKAWERGCFTEGFNKRKEKTIAARPLCACGCGKHVERSGFKYYKNHFENCGGNPAELHKFRDMPKLCAENSVRLTAKMKEWKETGRLDEIRRKAGNAKGMPDHIAAKHWTIRDPNGLTHEFSNLGEWARRHEHLFEDCAPASKLPHWLRISGGIGDLLNAKGRSCSYRGWVAVSKTELEEGAPDPLARDKQPNEKS
jgi:hypothetical protein